MVKVALLALSSWFVFNTCIDLVQGYALFKQHGKNPPREPVSR